VDFGEYFYYDEESPTCLKWKIDRYGGRNKKVIIKKQDSYAGTYVGNHGYYVVNINRTPTLVHRIIYALHFGEIPKGMTIDHIDGDKKNNKISNLRCVSYKINHQNKNMYLSNNSGVTGVSKRKDRTGAFYWVAEWVVSDTKRKSKWFSCLKYGEDLAKQLAIISRDNAILSLIDSGELYTERHGK